MTNPPDKLPWVEVKVGNSVALVAPAGPDLTARLTTPLTLDPEPRNEKGRMLEKLKALLVSVPKPRDPSAATYICPEEAHFAYKLGVEAGRHSLAAEALKALNPGAGTAAESPG